MEIYIEDPDLGTLVHMYQGLGDQNELELSSCSSTSKSNKTEKHWGVSVSRSLAAAHLRRPPWCVPQYSKFLNNISNPTPCPPNLSPPNRFYPPVRASPHLSSSSRTTCPRTTTPITALWRIQPSSRMDAHTSRRLPPVMARASSTTPCCTRRCAASSPRTMSPGRKLSTASSPRARRDRAGQARSRLLCWRPAATGTPVTRRCSLCSRVRTTPSRRAAPRRVKARRKL